MLAFDGCLVQAMDCRIVRKSIMAVGFFFEVGWSAFGAAARQEKQKVCIAACMHVSAIAFACARQKTKKRLCMPAQGNQTTIQCMLTGLCVFRLKMRLCYHCWSFHSSRAHFCRECGQLLSWHFDPREERRKERKRRRLEAVEAEEAKLWGDAEQIGGSNAY